jgi:hypothetical protein
MRREKNKEKHVNGAMFLTPPTISERQDLGPQRRKKKSKGKKKAVTFVDIPEAFFLEDEERNQLLPPRAGLLGPQPRLPLPPPPAHTGGEGTWISVGTC